MQTRDFKTWHGSFVSYYLPLQWKGFPSSICGVFCKALEKLEMDFNCLREEHKTVKYSSYCFWSKVRNKVNLFVMKTLTGFRYQWAQTLALSANAQQTRQAFLWNLPVAISPFSSVSQCGPHRPEENRLLWHRRGGGRPSENPDEQLPVLRQQPTGNRHSRNEGVASGVPAEAFYSCSWL